MASKLFKPLNKVMGAIGLVEEDDDDIVDRNDTEDDDEYDYDEMEKITNANAGSKSKVVSIKSNSSPRVMLKKPLDLKGTMEIIDSVKSRRIVVMNLVDIDAKNAQRIIDCVVGGCYALNASFQQIAKSVYLIAPESVSVTNELKEVLTKEKDFFDYD